MKNTIVLLSGGLDSATCLAIAKANGFAPIYTMAFDYGQRHRHELHAASALAKQASMIEHRVVPIDLRQFGGSALTADIAVPKDQIKDVTTARRADSPAVRPKDSPIGLPQDSPTSRLADPLPITYVP
ncbi:MAG: 7-cyano-7-deazaguanine synthase, partial [Burkholderiales bacterium]|nr:7-cyano-7-deazaguanine synthase [Phycisphaerae bacterium]